jgi:ABC-2 type transport system ATP-binding protein
LSETEASCDRVSILRRGQLVYTESLSNIRREHRIRARITGPLQPPPDELSGDIEIAYTNPQEVVIQTAGELSSLFGWLATLPLREVRIEPVSLQVIYDRFHDMNGTDAA